LRLTSSPQAFLEGLRFQFDEWKRAAPAMVGAVVPLSPQQFAQHLHACDAWPLLQKWPGFVPVLYEEVRECALFSFVFNVSLSVFFDLRCSDMCFLFCFHCSLFLSLFSICVVLTPAAAAAGV
jgi:hypothetical protein